MPDKNLRIEEEDHAWIKKNRGADSMKKVFHEALEKYKEWLEVKK